MLKFLLHVSLLAVMLMQTSASVCGAQCVEHQLPPVAGHAMAGCHTMPEHSNGDGLAARNCTVSQAFCAVDLLANARARSPLPVTALDLNAAVLPNTRTVYASRSAVASRIGIASPPLITALRV